MTSLVCLSGFTVIFSVMSQHISLSVCESCFGFFFSQSTAAGGEGDPFLSPMGGNESKGREQDREAVGQQSVCF